MKALDLCNGGMIWSCCVPRDRLGTQVRGSGSPEDYILFGFYLQTDIESPHAIHNASKCFFILRYKAALYCLPARTIMFIKFQLFLQQSRWSMLNELKVYLMS